MCCSDGKHDIDDCCKVEAIRQEEYRQMVATIRELRLTVKVWREKFALLEDRASVLSAEAKRLSEQLARTYE